MPHDPSHHLLRTDFPADVEAGLTPPTRRTGATTRAAAVAPTAPGRTDVMPLVLTPFGLRITSPGRAEPEGYLSGNVIRPTHAERGLFSGGANVLRIPAAVALDPAVAARPLMPPIPVQVECTGFDPSRTPLRWRLQVGHTFCRYTNSGSYRYSPVNHRFTAEWQGESSAARFTLFDHTDTHAGFTFGNLTDSPVGGHGILSVAAYPDGASDWLVDYVHLLIGGTSPNETTARAGITSLLAGRSENISRMVMAIFAHESGFRQFNTAAMSRTSRTFRANQHTLPATGRPDPTQPDCRVEFVFPGDPANFPLASYDFGVGISQYTVMAGQPLTAGIPLCVREVVASPEPRSAAT